MCHCETSKISFETTSLEKIITDLQWVLENEEIF